ncbi:16S rRNA (adenine(1518)-N(6)/adenine(1519)-N(6))-dimethyltransferase RsmA [Buchnera aphidicola]|jgi:16S rRNA (adenine1518-N6/adenine1519-N6)-dimethyltransferase|uniref:Ribosomal RNA small subunit methyltransferase A n=1 Tax=Buchnera aphidicola subsp. Schizaphis graminum (strain Sg) TaxID=198804 RepID=RSMA_BUCAP|nr:16S rRNA (adenine(1518)-N(6)/adenine(1519)-N(6))-dimethyltransferase RsmA [Buchnera aphidicola]Q8KA00.1 RecName: Full=Ribosomal RNA small subunit methyltransferase A; AltName: Full=16S rRNA (adenine(1518)-N(6)/adenine(1519)-N(6))-dimethyltransferase; AltName: Full=16S rRNA dimethyladenosine transferase; AltName: Full=16S rRNA dimethylase; AltName: Full=S-adenosylmethionine-6-N', N'-adenosyl(rRNA) dimethyltransferase [Buchnera aphidicola str. Sg (Schizaphis graminum)]AAM67702.1 dimethyladenosin
MKKKIKKHLPLKRFSQNFLINQNLIKKIVKFINPQLKQTLVEIGPGLGALTKPICNIVDELIVIEIDLNLLNFLKKYSFYSKLIVFCQDALIFDYLNLFYKKNKLIRIFGNLPYHISTSLLFCFFEKNKIIQDMNFMLQKEVAERLIAFPGTKSYGRLSIIAQYYCNIKIIFNVASENFRPIPKIDSTFVNLVPHKKSPYFTHDIKVLSYITNLAFQKRRKILRHSLGKIFSEKIFLKLNVDPKLRAENLSILQYCQLSNYIIENDILKNKNFN